MATLKLLAVAINTQRMGCVFFAGHELKDWRAMTKPTRSQSDAAEALQRLINNFAPDVVVTQQHRSVQGKRFHNKDLRAALNRTAAQNFVLDVTIERPREFANKYEEASALAELYPELRHEVPPARRSFDHQPARLILFDALALAHQVLQRPTQQLAAAMG